jgi:hypothetical protein
MDTGLAGYPSGYWMSQIAGYPATFTGTIVIGFWQQKLLLFKVWKRKKFINLAF